jgi:hypothetical protein
MLSKHDHLSRLSGVNEMPCAATAIFVHQQFVTSRTGEFNLQMQIAI